MVLGMIVVASGRLEGRVQQRFAEIGAALQGHSPNQALQALKRVFRLLGGLWYTSNFIQSLNLFEVLARKQLSIACGRMWSVEKSVRVA